MVGLCGSEIQHTRTRLHVVITNKTAVCSFIALKISNIRIGEH